MAHRYQVVRSLRSRVQVGNIYGDLNRRGYRQQTNSNLNSSVTLDWGLDFITKGLSTKIMAAFDTKSRTIRQGVRLYDQYDVHVATTPDDRCYYTEIQSNQNDAQDCKYQLLSESSIFN